MLELAQDGPLIRTRDTPPQASDQSPRPQSGASFLRSWEGVFGLEIARRVVRRRRTGRSRPAAVPLRTPGAHLSPVLRPDFPGAGARRIRAAAISIAVPRTRSPHLARSSKHPLNAYRCPRSATMILSGERKRPPVVGAAFAIEGRCNPSLGCYRFRRPRMDY